MAQKHKKIPKVKVAKKKRKQQGKGSKTGPRSFVRSQVCSVAFQKFNNLFLFT